jgi:hypothetical protein
LSEQENPQPTMPTTGEVLTYTETWGTTVDEVAEWLRDHDIHDHPRLGHKVSFTQGCVVAMGLRAHFPALEATTDRWMVLGGGGIKINYEVAALPEPVRQLIHIADNDRGTSNPRYPFLYGPSE